MIRNCLKLISILGLGVSLAGCGADGTLTGSAGSVLDFLKSEIIVNGKGIADGASDYVVVVRLMSSKGKPIVNYRPEYNVSPSNGVTTASCSLSDSNGMSVCLVKSTVAGVKTFAVTNIKMPLDKSIEFITANSSRLMGVAAGSKERVLTGSSYVVNSSVTGLGSPVKQTTGGGYQVYSSVRGALESSQ